MFEETGNKEKLDEDFEKEIGIICSMSFKKTSKSEAKKFNIQINRRNIIFKTQNEILSDAIRMTEALV